MSKRSVLMTLAQLALTTGCGGGSSAADAGVDAHLAPGRLQPTDLAYQGAFRLPEELAWGARGLSYYPIGAGGAGTLFVTGFELLQDLSGTECWEAGADCVALFGHVGIPEPEIHASWEDLPPATLLQPIAGFDGGLASSVHPEYVWVSGIEYVPRTGSQFSDKLYGSIDLWYAEGVMGEDSFPTIWFSELDGSLPRGMFHVGPEEPPFHGRKMGDYLFTVPQWYATQYLGGRTMVTGRSRGTPATGEEEITVNGGSQGPTLFAFRAWETEHPTGFLDALPLLYYRVKFPACAGPNVGEPESCDYPDFTMCDIWTGGSFVTRGEDHAILLAGFKGLGDNCYDEPPIVCDDPCGDAHGYHCDPYERQIIFYDVAELGAIATGDRDPWSVLPYTIWRPTELYLDDSPCWSLGGLAFDRDHGRLFLVERGLGEGDANAAVVHVWSTVD